MIYKKFKDILLSRLGMGNMRLPTKKVQSGTVIDKNRAQQIIDYAMNNGINYYDTAYMYHNGESEEFLGEALKKYDRSSYYLATKFNINANPDYKAVFDEQLSKLNTDYIDFYLIHALSDSTMQRYIDEGSVNYFNEQKKAGKIKFLGFSTHASVGTLEKFADYTDWDFAQMQLNYFDWLYSHTKAEYQALKQRDIPIVVMEPVRGGRLATLSDAAESKLKSAHPDWSMASWAFRWIKRLPQVMVVLSGMSEMNQIIENIETFSDDISLSAEEEILLFEACEAFKKEVTVPCTGCRYCCDDCPAEINIPEYLTIYNKYKTDGRWYAINALKKVDSKGKPEDCIACGVCTELCPQDIDVKSVMSELAEIQK
jgi:hypothetical protein